LSLASSDDRALEVLTAGRKFIAKVSLKDGRAVSLPVTVLPARPGIGLLAQSLRVPAPMQGVLSINLVGAREIPRGAIMTFSIQARGAATIAPNDSVEVSTADGAFSTSLTAGAGLTREDAHLAVATLDTAQAFGPSAFGPLRFRLIDPRGDSDWQDLGILVRLPTLTGLKCSGSAPSRCNLSGEKLFLIEAIASHASFDDATVVPEGFPGDHLETPRPQDGRLYLKLHDDPSSPAVIAFGSHRAKPAKSPVQLPIEATPPPDLGPRATPPSRVPAVTTGSP
jgi:hypothetical protein